MKSKLWFLSFLIALLIVVAILFAANIYYAAIALVIGWTIINYRELWSLLRHGKLPPIDERIRENVNKSLRNSFIFFGIASILTIFLYATVPPDLLRPDLELYLAALLAFICGVYALSYLFYDRIETNLSDKELKLLRVLLVVGGISFFIFFFNTFYAGSIYPSIEWLAFHRIMLIGSALMFAIGIIACLTIFLKNLFAKPKHLSN